MNIKRVVSRFIYSFLIVFSVSFIFMYVFRHFWGVEAFDMIPRSDAHGLFVLAALASLASFILEPKRELSRKEMLVRYIFHMLAITVIVISTAIFMGWISWNQPVRVILFAGGVIVVYFVLTAIEWHQSKGMADQLNQKLKERYK